VVVVEETSACFHQKEIAEDVELHFMIMDVVLELKA
tara:strand:+ start:383 stop:490 length:108 start_codon:yes stop_codon:yes gene_type:complete